MKSLEEIAQALINKNEVSETEMAFLKKNLLNEPGLVLFKNLYEKCPEKIPSTSVRYMTNPDSISLLIPFIEDFKQVSLNKGYKHSPLRLIKKGILSNKILPDSEKAKVAFFSDISFYSIEGYSGGLMSRILDVQMEYPQIQITEEIIEVACQGLLQKKIEGDSLSNFINFLYDKDSLGKYFIDKFLTQFSFSFEYILPKLSSSSLADVCALSAKLYREYNNSNINRNHHMVKTKIKRLEKLDLKIRMAVNEELKKRPDSLTYLLI